jgi:hypothetical protein
MKKVLIFGLLLAAAVLVSVETNRVVGQADANADSKETVSRTYDITDLVAEAKDYSLTGDFVPLSQISRSAPDQNGQRQNFYNNPNQQQQPPPQDNRWNRVGTITKFITDNVAQTTWKDNGGDVGSISSNPIYARIIVTQTAENQKAIQTLLDDLRNSIHRVRIRADWLLLSPGEVEKLQKNGIDDTAVVPEISRDLIRALPANTVHYSGSIACFDGQTVYITSGRAKTIVTGVTPVVAPGSVAMDPTISNVHEGMALEVTPTVATDSVILDLHSIMSEPNKAVNVPSTRPDMPALEHIDSMMQDFRTTVRVPLNKPVLVGGSTADPNPDLPAGKLLYLIIQADTAK